MLLTSYEILTSLLSENKTSHFDTQEFIKISKQVWNWAKNRPEYHDLIEDLEDLELINQARSEKGESVSLEEYNIH